MSFVQCIYADIHGVVKPLKRLIRGDSDKYRGYYSKSFQRKRNVMFDSMDPRSNAIMYYYHSPLQDSSHCSLNETDIVTRCFSLLLCAIIVYLATKTLFAKYRGFKARQTNASTLIDETEVELNTIDSIDEFEKMSKTGTSDEGRPGRRGRKRLQCSSEDTDSTLNLSGSCTSNQETRYKSRPKTAMDIYSILYQPLTEIRNMLSNFSSYKSNRRKSTDDEQVGKCRKRQTQEPTAQRDNNRTGRTSPRESINLFQEANSDVPNRQLCKQLKDCSVNTEIKSFRINELSFSSVDKTSENETDLEKEMALIDIPTNYYYEHQLSESQPSPCLISLKNRKRKDRPY